MKRFLLITTNAIDEASLLSQRQMSSGMGAAIYFSGVVRAAEEDFNNEAIDYEAHVKMAEHQFHLLFNEMEKRWPIESVRLVHRIGIVKVNEASLWSASRNVGATVSGLLAGIVWVDLLAVGGESSHSILILAGFFGLARLFQKFIPAT